MPFVNRQIQPIWLAKGCANADKLEDHINNAPNTILVNALHQLSSLIQHADGLFADLAQECQTVADRTSKLRWRVENVGDLVESLDAKRVKVPVGDILEFATHVGHYQAQHGFETSLFTLATRPASVADLYDNAEPSPLEDIRFCNRLRSDGRTGSKIFSVPFVVDNDGTKDKSPLSPQQKRVVTPVKDRPRKSLREPRLQRPRSFCGNLSEIDVEPGTQKRALPTPQEHLRNISRSQPVMLIPIDVSGHSFQRLCEHRNSQRNLNRDYVDLDISTKSIKRRVKRRQTVCGVPGIKFDENASNYVTIRPHRTRSVSRDRWDMCRLGYIEDYASLTSLPGGRKSRSRERRSEWHSVSRQWSPTRSESPDMRSCNLRRSLRSLFCAGSKSTELWMNGRPSSPEHTRLSLKGTLRRCRSLPRSLSRGRRHEVTLRSECRSASTEGRLDAWVDTEEARDTYGTLPLAKKHLSAIPLTGSLPRIRSSRSEQMVGRMSTFLEGRSQSARDVRHRGYPVAVPLPGSTSSISAASLGSSDLSGYPHRSIVPGQPAWAAFAADVRLRHHDKDGRDDRQSSSGHWSASSSSARHSLDSDYNRALAMQHSQNSLNYKDSALSLNIPSEERYDTTTDNNEMDTSTVTGGDGSTVCGDTSTLQGSNASLNQLRHPNKPANKQNSKKQQHRFSLPLRRLLSDSSREDSPLWASSSQLTQKNLQAHDSEYFTSYLSPPTPDEESSVYSVDQEGFYTSMHKDSGLRRSCGDFPRMDRMSYLSSSDSTLNSSPLPINRNKDRRKPGLFSGFNKLRAGKRSKKKTPPPPPRRMSTIIDQSTQGLNDLQEGSLDDLDNILNISPENTIKDKEPLALKLTPSPSAGPEASECESDAEVVYARLQKKTSISTDAFPSLCAIVLSDEEDADMLAGGNPWRAQSDAGSLHSLQLGSEQAYASTPKSGGTARQEMDSPYAGTWPRQLRLSPARSTSSRTTNGGLSPTAGSSTQPSVPPSKTQAKPPAVPKRQSSLQSSSSKPTHVFANVVIKSRTAGDINRVGSLEDLAEERPRNVKTSSNRSSNVTQPLHITVPADGLAPSGARPPVGTMMTTSTAASEPVWQRMPKKSSSGPVAAPAKLIISKQVATKVSFKQNPYKRSVCSPVSDQELLNVWNCELQETDIDDDKSDANDGVVPVQPSKSKPPRPALSQPTNEKSALKNYGKSWYEGIATKPIESSYRAMPAHPLYVDVDPQQGMQPRCDSAASIRSRDSVASSTVSGNYMVINGNRKHSLPTEQRIASSFSTFSSSPSCTPQSTPQSTPYGSLTRPKHLQILSPIGKAAKPESEGEPQEAIPSQPASSSQSGPVRVQYPPESTPPVSSSSPAPIIMASKTKSIKPGNGPRVSVADGSAEPTPADKTQEPQDTSAATAFPYELPKLNTLNLASSWNSRVAKSFSSQKSQYLTAAEQKDTTISDNQATSKKTPENNNGKSSALSSRMQSILSPHSFPLPNKYPVRRTSSGQSSLEPPSPPVIQSPQNNLNNPPLSLPSPPPLTSPPVSSPSSDQSPPNLPPPPPLTPDSPAADPSSPAVLSCLDDSFTSMESTSILTASTPSLSLSNTSIASVTSNHALKMNAAKLAFLADVNETPAPEPTDPFSRYLKSPGTTAPKTTSSEQKPGAVQGRFVNSVISQLHQKSDIADTDTQPTSPSSGLGSSLATTPASPLTPGETPAATESSNGCKTAAHGYTDAS